MKLSEPKNIRSLNLFIDGLPRSGKSSLCQTIISLKNSEHIDMATNLEYIMMGVILKKITYDFAKVYLKTHFNQSGYNKLIGRGVNFRPTDFTGVANFRDPKIYTNRLKIFSYGRRKYHYKKTHIRVKSSHDPALHALNTKYFFFPFQSHLLLSNFEEFRKLDLNYKIIELVRNPIDVTHSIISRGLLESNAKKDPRKLNLDIFCKNKSLPWFVHGYANSYIEANRYEKAALVVINELEKMIKNRKIIKPQIGKKILFLSFEKFVTNTKKEMQKIANFLKTKTTKSTNKFIKNANCPRILDLKSTNKKFEFLSKYIKNQNLLDRLVRLESEYKKNLYNFN